ncbi:MAG: restriction endonuclease subunit S [Sulfuritalea sp.]|nr:restriction endonuclease subunit S [Sulfuritalea sp.]
MKLADCVDLLAGFAFKSQYFTNRPDDIPLVKGENVSQGGILWEISKRWSAADWSNLEKYQLRSGDVVVAMDRPWVPAGLKWAYIRSDDPKALLVQRCSRLRSNTPKLDQDFLRFVIGGPGFESYVMPITTGVNVPHISGSQILDYEFALPPLPVQQRIAGILSAYDELIENSRRRIKILEAMARALYREWFVHFRFPDHENHPRVASPLGEIPQGWEVKKLGDIAENFDRMRKPLSKMQRSQLQGEYPYYGAAKVFDYVNGYIFDGEYLLLAEDGSVITPERAPVLQLVNEKFWPNNHTHVLRGKSPFSTHFLYLGLSEVDISPYITGAAQPKITQENMNRIPFFCGPEYLHIEFNLLVEPTIRQSHILQRQVQNLRRTRDLLLPRLLSGQIDVSNQPEPVPA